MKLNLEGIASVKDNVAAADKVEEEKLNVKAASKDETRQNAISEDNTSHVKDQIKDSIKEEVKDNLEESIDDENALPEDEEFHEFLERSDSESESREHDSEEL